MKKQKEKGSLTYKGVKTLYLNFLIPIFSNNSLDQVFLVKKWNNEFKTVN